MGNDTDGSSCGKRGGRFGAAPVLVGGPEEELR